MILVTGATGNLGKSVVAQLQKYIEKDAFIVSSSTVHGVKELREQGLQARLANFDQKETLFEAFKGIEKLLLISTMDFNRFEQHKNVIDTAKQQGVKHVVYTSLAIQDIASSGVKDIMKSHFQTENYLKESSLTYTILRNTMYAEALQQIIGMKLKNEINLPGGTGLVPYVLRREIGEATANLLLQSGHENKVYSVVGSASYSYYDIAKALSELKGQEVTYNAIDDEEYCSYLEKRGFVDFAVYLFTGTVQDIKQKQYEIQDDQLEKLLGRPSANLHDFLAEVFRIQKN